MRLKKSREAGGTPSHQKLKMQDSEGRTQSQRAGRNGRELSEIQRKTIIFPLNEELGVQANRIQILRGRMTQVDTGHYV